MKKDGKLHDLERGCENVLRQAETLKCRSISIPPISCGIFSHESIPKGNVMEVIVKTLINYPYGRDSSISLVRFVAKGRKWTMWRDILKKLSKIS